MIVYKPGQPWLSRPKPPSTPLLHLARMLSINFQPHLVSDVHLRMPYTASSQYTILLLKAASEPLTDIHQIAFQPSQHLKHFAIFPTTTIHQAMHIQKLMCLMALLGVVSSVVK